MRYVVDSTPFSSEGGGGGRGDMAHDLVTEVIQKYFCTVYNYAREADLCMGY